MKLNNITVLYICQYAAPYEGNFILSLKKMESVLLNNYQSKVVYVFPEKVKVKNWMMSFLKTHQVHFLQNEPEFCVKELIKIFEEEHPHLIHTHFDGYDIPVVKAFNIYKLNNKDNVEIVWHLHDHLSYQKNLLKKCYQYYCFWKHYCYYGKDVSVIAVSIEVLRFVDSYRRKMIFPSSICHSSYKRKIVIPNGIDLSRIGDVSQGFGKLDVFTFLAYGGRNVSKRIDLLIKACLLLEAKGIIFKVILTKGTDTEDIVDQFFKGDNPKWLDLIDQTENIIDLFKNSSCFVSTSVAETFSYAIAEVSIWGLPVIQSDIEGTSWNVGNPSCFVFKSLDVEDLARKMELVMNLDFVKLRKDCYTSRQNNLKNYTIGSWSQKILSFYEQL